MDILAKQKFTNVLIIALVIINIGCLSFIWFNKPGSSIALPPPDRKNVDRFLDKELGLNSDQENKFNEFRREHFETTIKFQNKIGRFKREILAESFNQKPDMQKIAIMTDSIGSLQKGYETFLSEHFQKLASVCTPEQREKLKDIFLSSFEPKRRPGIQPPPGRGMRRRPLVPPR
jgi:hypothetical protein